MERKWVTLDGNEAASYVAYKLSEVAAIYPITPSTPMGELADAWSANQQPNLWGTVPLVVEMQSEGGAAGAIHGSLQSGALSTTFTASQGLLLMIPNMYKIAGELTPTVFHVAARSLAAQGLSIFGDHSDVMSTRSTGFALIASNSVQEAQDLALISHAATLESRIPFLHFFDGFRTSHEINKIEQVNDDDFRAMIDEDLIRAHRSRALSPDHPFIRGTAQNPDVYFQARETVNPFYDACPGIVQKYMDQFGKLTGRQYHLFDYYGAADAERVVIVMGSGAETVEETVKYLVSKGEKVGVLKVRLFRPFSIESFAQALPATVKSIAVLDRTKEPGAAGEPLYLDVITALNEAQISPMPRVIGGRYGLSSKEFTPAMVKAVYDELGKAKPKNHFTIGINDDVTHTSLAFDQSFKLEYPGMVQCIFWGLGSDGTVGANKNSIKIIGEETENYAQGYFVYDSKKSGSSTISHLRFGPEQIRAPYLVDSADFLACHVSNFLEHVDMLKQVKAGGVFLLNTPYGPNEIWNTLPQEVQATILEKKLRFYVIDAVSVARETKMGNRINTIMQTCFFAISGVLPFDQAIEQIKYSIKKTYGKRGEKVVQQNFLAVDKTLAELHQVTEFGEANSAARLLPPVTAQAPEFVQYVLGKMIKLEGDDLPVSAMPVDGTYPSATSQWEKRNLALEIPAWEMDLCIQCGKCALVCPHAAIRTKIYDPALLEGAPAAFLHTEARFKEFPGQEYSLQVSPEDCTGCALCVEVCPATDKKNKERKALNLIPQPPVREQERANWDFFFNLPEVDRLNLNLSSIKNSQLMQPLFEFSGACSGCGETPYLKLLTQLFGDRMMVANATGCSSIFGGNLPTTPWSQNRDGRGPAWANSLFEDNAEFGLGMRVTLDKQQEYARELVAQFNAKLGEDLVNDILKADQSTEAGIAQQRDRVAVLKEKLQGDTDPKARDLVSLANALVRKSVWIVGGDGWAYDIGYGGLDHVLASGKNVKVLVLDTEVYSNTGGQASKATPRGAVARFAANGKATSKKDLGGLAMTYQNIYVARVAMGANDQQTLKAFLEAEAYDGPALIIAYAHCIHHGIDIRYGLDHQKKAVQSGGMMLYRYNPELAQEGKNPLVLDSKEPSISVNDFTSTQTRFTMLEQTDKAHSQELIQEAQEDVKNNWAYYQSLSKITKNGDKE